MDRELESVKDGKRSATQVRLAQNMILLRRLGDGAVKFRNPGGRKDG